MLSHKPAAGFSQRRGAVDAMGESLQGICIVLATGLAGMDFHYPSQRLPRVPLSSLFGVSDLCARIIEGTKICSPATTKVVSV